VSFMDIFNGFRGATTTTPTAQPTPDPAANKGTAAGNPTIPNSTTPTSDGSTPAFPATAKGEASPLANYENLWTIDTTKATPTPTLTPAMTVDPTKIMEVARTMDFTKGLDAEVLSKASKGDVEALASLINGASQNAYAQGAMATTQIVRNAFSLQEKNFNESVMPSILRRHSISNAVAENPLSNNPAAAPLLQTLESQLAAKYPTASPAEIKTHAEQYLTGLATEIVRGQGGTILPKDNAGNDNPYGLGSRKDEDWEKFFGVPATMSS
jgi:hypothetical protein